MYSNVEFLSNDLQWYSFTARRWVDEWRDLSPSGGYVLRFSPDGRYLALPSHAQLTVWDLARRKRIASQDLPAGPTPLLAYSPDGARLVYGAGRRLIVADPAGRKPAAELRGGRWHFTAVAFHPSGRFLATAGNDGAVKLWDAATWRVAKAYTWGLGRVRTVAFSPDGLLAAAGGDNGTVVVWDVDG